MFRASLLPIFRSTKTTASTASDNHYTVLLSAAIVEELELISTDSNFSTIAEDNSTV